jgi:adenosylcobinamide-GDP ribazoletransferase
LIGLGAYAIGVLTAGMPPLVSATLIVAYLIFINGALHLDGVADTADGIFSFRDRERMLEIMKDSRLGSMGAVAIVMVLLAKFAGAASLENPLYLLLVPAYGRFSIIFGFYFFKYAREEGTAKAFFGNFPPSIFYQGIPLVAITLFMGFKVFLVVNLVFLVYTIIISGRYRSKIGGITGDMLGAMCEVGEAVIFLAVACL